MKKVFPSTPKIVFLGPISIIVILIVANLVKSQGLFPRPSSLQKNGLPVSSPTPTPTPTPTPKPLTFAEMNALYGPCVYLPTVMYHHVRDLTLARSQGDLGLSVDPGVFKSQMQYLKDKGYNILTMKDLINFFDSGIPTPARSLLLTFDDGYEDFSLNAMPVLKEFGFRATMFLPTGLVGNPGFLNWGQVSDAAASGLIYFANHTWSHHSVAVSKEVDQKEISTADTQLKEHGLNQDLVFAYPYGNFGDYAVQILQSMNYKVAFTTIPGSTLCKKQRLTLPRNRVGNSPLSAYGF